MTCDGSCETHTGDVVQVHVWSATHNWGEFWYCDTAQAEDQRRGLTVEVVEARGEYPWNELVK